MPLSSLVGHSSDGYRVSTSVYEGPLDLLLELIERAELDITALALAQVTDQYLAYLKTLESQDPSEVSAFLVIAARLLQIKSAALLPRPRPDDHFAEEDTGEALAQQLILYRRFKQLGEWLREREESGLRSYLRVAPPPVKVEPKLDMSGITLESLLSAAKELFTDDEGLAELSSVVNLPRVTIRESVEIILAVLRRLKKSSFRAVLSDQSAGANRLSRLEVVVTFLALLELIKRHVVEARQAALFEDIELEVIGEWQDKDEAEIEFE